MLVEMNQVQKTFLEPHIHALLSRNILEMNKLDKLAQSVDQDLSFENPER